MAQEETKSIVNRTSPTDKVRHPQLGCLEKESKNKFHTRATGEKRKAETSQHVPPNFQQKFFMQTRNSLFSHHIPLHAVGIFQDVRSVRTLIGGSAMTTKRRAFLD